MYINEQDKRFAAELLDKMVAKLTKTADVVGDRMPRFTDKETGIKLDLEALSDASRKAGATIIAGKGATFYGVAMSTAQIVQAVFDDENAVIPVSHVIEEGEYAGVAFSLPCIINRTGIVRAVKLPLNEAEQAALKHSADVIRNSINNIQ